MRDFKITLAYDGTAYAGWQVQLAADTVQARVEQALETIVRQRVRVIASGRTDAGVHALGQVASFRCDTRLAPDVLRRALNANLPSDIVILQVEQAARGFHAIRDAVSKRYRYVIQDGPIKDVFARNYAWQFHQVLDEQRMRQAAEHLLGTHDFSAFEASGSPRANSVRTISDVLIKRESTDLASRIILEFEADGFLYNMVRNLVGSLVEVGRGAQSSDWFLRLLAQRDRRLAGPTAPPQGLFLVSVEYEG